MLIGVAQGQEGEEDFLVPAEIGFDDFGGSLGIVQDRAMMLHHAARLAAGAAGVDDAGGLVAGDAGDLLCHFRDIGVAALDEVVPAVEVKIAGLADAQVGDADDDIGVGGADHRGQQVFRQLAVGDDHRMGAAVVEDMLVIRRGVGGVGRHGDAAGGHDAEIGDAPFGAVLRDKHHPVTLFQADALERFGQRRDLPRRLVPAGRLPGPVDLGMQERLVAALAGAVEEHRYQILILIDFEITVFCLFPDHAVIPLSHAPDMAGAGSLATGLARFARAGNYFGENAIGCADRSR